MKNEKRNALTIILFAIYILLLTEVIIFKFPFYSEKLGGIRVINLIPFKGSFDENGAFLLSEVVYNILIFIPLGVYIRILKSEWNFKKKALPVIGLTVAFEALQFIFAIGITDITDVICNTLGEITGIGIYALLFRIFKNRTAAVVNILALAVTVCVAARFSQLFYLSHFVMRRSPR